MHNDTYEYPVSSTMTGIILSSEQVGTGTHQHQHVRIAHEGGIQQAIAVSGPELASAARAPLTARIIDLVHNDNGRSALPLLVGQSEDPFSYGITYFPENTCPVEGIVNGTKRLIGELSSVALHDFVIAVFQRRDVFRHFWTMPAAARHHHAFPGGLAVHTLEVADDIARHGGLTSWEHELGIAGALLHDIGKIWSYTEDMFLNSAGLAMGHELLGLARVEPELAHLEGLWPDGAYVMRCLLSGHSRMRSDGSLPTSLLQRIKACDQRSCEHERARTGSSTSRQVWMPKAWSAPTSSAEVDADLTW